MAQSRPVYQILWALLVVTLIFPAASYGQAIGMKRNDVTPPIINHSPPPVLTEGMPIRIQAVVTDNVGVKEVSLFYREVGSREFQRVPMLEAPGRDIYSVDLPFTAGSLIEYFIQAIDLAGNIGPEQLVDPYVIKMPSVAVAITDIEHSRGDLSQKKSAGKGGVNKWVWVGLGVVAAGAVLMSGGSSGGGSDADGTGGTGTVTITGPAP